MGICKSYSRASFKVNHRQNMKKDFKNYKIKLNMRAMCLYEAITGKSFFDFSEDNMEDMFKVLYCSFVANNDLKMTLGTFLKLLEDKEVQKWLLYEYDKIGKFNTQFSSKSKDGQDNTEKSTEKLKARDIAGFLIVRCGMDADYVYDRMNFFEIEDYMRAFEAEQKDNLERERLWTYLTISPQIDGKKIKSPEDMLKFSWEKEDKKESLDNNMDLIRKILGKKNGQYDIISESSGLSEDIRCTATTEHDRQEQDNTAGTEGGSEPRDNSGKTEPCEQEQGEERKPEELIQEGI